MPTASQFELWRALRLSAAEDFVSRLPAGLHTLIGDRGVRLSGGECQRLALARAMLRQPAILILDEATSSLDAHNQQRIQRALANLQGKLTIVIIAHRLSTVRNADHIVVLDRGRIVQQGKFAELASDDQGTFRLLIEADSGVPPRMAAAA